MKFIDFFAGIGGFTKGMENAGHECVGVCEFDKFARYSYAAMHLLTEAEKETLLKINDYKKGQKYIDGLDIEGRTWFARDIRTVKPTDIPYADIWCGGFPCQGNSIAGRRKGLEDERSGLFEEIIRLLQGKKEEDKPRILLLENVKGLYSVNGGWDFAEILNQLDEVGYDAEWALINSSDVVPQNRERIFIVGYLRGKCSGRVFPITGSDSEDIELQKQSVNTLTCKYGSKGRGSYIVESKQRKKVKCVNAYDSEGKQRRQHCRVYDPSGNSPTLTAVSGGRLIPKIIDPQGRKGKKLIPREYCPTLRAESHGNTPLVIQCSRGYNKGGENEICPTLTRNSWQHNNFLYDGGRVRELTEKECFRLQTWPDEYFYLAKAVNSKTQLHKQAGNGVTVDVVTEIGKRIVMYIA